MGWETLLLLSAAGGAAYAVFGYLKNRKEGEPFSFGKFLGTVGIGALGGAAKLLPVVGDILVGAGASALAKTGAQAAKNNRKLPKNTI